MGFLSLEVSILVQFCLNIREGIIEFNEFI